MESIIALLHTTFTSPFLVTLLVVVCCIGLVFLSIKNFFDKKRIHTRLLEIAFERGTMDEKSRFI